MSCPSSTGLMTTLSSFKFGTPSTWRCRFPYSLPQEQGKPDLHPGIESVWLIYMSLYVYIVTNGGWGSVTNKTYIWIGYWPYSLTLQATTDCSPLKQLLQQRLLLGPNRPTVPPGPTKRLGLLGSLGSWTATRPAFSGQELDLSVNCHLTLQLLRTVLLNCSQRASVAG
jgi:hypothetical protein